MTSNYTVASGNERISKTLSDKRLDYLMEFVSKFVLLDKTYKQNFKDTYV